MVDIDGDGINDIILDAATGLPGIDLDGDGLIEVALFAAMVSYQSISTMTAFRIACCRIKMAMAFRK